MDVQDKKEKMLLDLARENYPIGTVYRDGSPRTVQGNFTYYSDPEIMTDGYGGAVYESGRWAEIISVPEPDITQIMEDLDQRIIKMEKRIKS